MADLQPSERRLSAILFADIAGYTALMQRDEAIASTLLRRFQNVMREKVAAHAGRIVNEMGDGMLCVFDSPIAAVRCAMALKMSFDEEPHVPVRFGIHSGTVVYEGEKVYGNSVNIASRIESIGIPGAILFSKKVRDEIKNQTDIHVESLGQHTFKNIDEPIEVYAVVNKGFEVPDKNALVGKLAREKKGLPRLLKAGIVLIAVILLVILYNSISSRKARNIITDKSIAVLPFSNESINQENQYFCNGIMEGILDHLSKIPDLIVISRSSVEQFRNNRPLVSEIGDKLNVKYIVEGSVQRIDDQALIFAQLIETDSDRHLWSERYDRDLSDIFAIQAEITQAIAGELQAVIAPELRQRLEAVPTTDMVAYDYYLQANEYLRLVNPQLQSHEEWSNSLNTAKVLYNLALQRDSLLAEAFVGLARVDYFKNRDEELQEEDYLENTFALTNKALELNPNLTDVYEMRCTYYFRHNQLSRVDDELDIWLKLSPGDVNALSTKAYMLRYHHFDFKESAKLYQKLFLRVREKDELDEIYHDLGSIFASIGDLESFMTYIELGASIMDDATYELTNRAFFKSAIGQNQEAIDFINDYFIKDNEAKMNLLSNAYCMMGDFPTALIYFQKWDSILNLQGSNFFTGNHDYHRYAYALTKTGQEKRGLNMLEKQKKVYLRNIELDRTGSSSLGSYYDLAGIYAFTGQKDSAYYWLEKLDENDIWLRMGWLSTFIQNDYQFDNIRDDKRFQQMLEAVLEKQRLVQKEVHEVIDVTKLMD